LAGPKCGPRRKAQKKKFIRVPEWNRVIESNVSSYITGGKCGLERGG